MKYRVSFEPSGKTVFVENETSALSAAQAAGVYVENICGGRGTCGKCRIRILSGVLSPVSDEERKVLSENDIRTGWRLACAALVSSDMTIRTANLKASVILEKTAARRIALNPAVRIVKATLDSPSLDDPRDDSRRLLDSLNLHDLTIDGAVLTELPRTLRTAHWKIAVLIWNEQRVLKIMAAEDARAYGVAIDIGTTTIAAYLCDLETGKLVKSASIMNPQIAFGDDVITRLSICNETAEGQTKLRSCLFDKLNEMIASMATAVDIAVDDIAEAVIAGNTVMHHIALGIDSEYLGRAPYTPATTQPIDMRAAAVGLAILPEGNVHFLPVIGGFVGGDTTAALLSEQPFPEETTTMLIDIGTNSEICLASSGRLAITSCATGPALEGAQIECGMRATAGAIDSVRIDPCTLEPLFGTIGDTETPIGICGSGIVDAVAQMAKTGIIDSSGRFAKDLATKHVRRSNRGGIEYVLFENERALISVTQKDVRAIQLAKAALYAGAQELLNRAGNPEIDRLVLAGAFGTYLDTANALDLGLFPDCRLDDIEAVGNAAGLGARIALLDVGERQNIRALIEQAFVVDTAAAPGFQNRFADAMAIPHSKDAFFRNKPALWFCSPADDVGQMEKMLPKMPFAQACAYATEEALFPNGRGIPTYPYRSLEQVDTRINLAEAPALAQTLDALSQEAGENTMLGVAGPTALLSTLIDPTSLYLMDSKMLDDALGALGDAIGDYMIAAIEHGARVISFSDAEGCVEIVGNRFFESHSGPALATCLKKVEPHLDGALVHLCGKTSSSLTGTGHAALYPLRIESATYAQALFTCASNKKCRFIGNNCVHTQNFKNHLLYRLELL